MISIKEAGTPDAPLIAKIGSQSFIESHGQSAPGADIELYVSTNYSVRKVEEELNNPENIFHVIYYYGKAAGYSKMIFNKAHPLVNGIKPTKLERLYLLKEFYDLNLGKTLFEYVIALSKKNNDDGMWLFTWTQNFRAINFCIKSGFEIVGKEDFKISETHSNPNYLMYLKY
jgi:diamine N-acetyltransferase